MIGNPQSQENGPHYSAFLRKRMPPRRQSTTDISNFQILHKQPAWEGYFFTTAVFLEYCAPRRCLNAQEFQEARLDLGRLDRGAA